MSSDYFQTGVRAQVPFLARRRFGPPNLTAERGQMCDRGVAEKQGHQCGRVPIDL